MKFLKKKRRLEFSLMILLNGLLLQGFSQTIFQKNYSGQDIYQSFKIHTIIPIAGNRYLFNGNSAQLGGTKMMVGITDASGTMQSGFHYGHENGDLVTTRSVMGPDSMVYTTGYFRHKPAQPSDWYFYINKMTAQCSLIWEKHFLIYGMGYELNAGNDIIILPDSSIVIGGTCGQSSEQSLLVRMDPNGNILWQKQYSTSYGQWITNIALHPGGDIIVTGIDSLSITFQPHVFISRITTAGTTVWSKILNLPVYMFESDITPTFDGNIAFVASEPVTRGTYLGKMDYNTGNLFWMKRYHINNDTLVGYSIIQQPNGDFIIGGHGSTFTKPSFMRTDSAGNFLSVKLFTGVLGAPIRKFEWHPDGTLLANSDVNFFKIAANLNTCSGVSGAVITTPVTAIANNFSPGVTGMVIPSVAFTPYYFGAWWNMITVCGGKCNLNDNFGGGLYASDQEYCKGKKLTFTAADVNSSTRDWTINGSSAGSQSPLVWQFNVPGFYEIQSIVQNVSGCKDTATTSVTITDCGPIIQPPPIATFTVGTFVGNVYNCSALATRPEGGVVLVSSGNAAQISMELTALDSAGNIVWAKRIGGSAIVSKGIIKTQGNGYLAYGIYNNNYLLVVKVDSNGNYLWHNAFRPVTLASGNAFVRDAIEMPDGSIILAGSVASLSGTTSSAYVIKIGSGGAGLWEKNYLFLSPSASFFSGLSYVSGNLWFGGGVGSYIGGIMGKINPANGNLIALYKIPWLKEITDIQLAKDNRLVIAGTVNNVGSYLAKLDGERKIMWDTRFGYETGPDIFQTQDSGFMVVNQGTNNVSQYSVVKTDKFGCRKGAFTISGGYESNIVKELNGACWIASGYNTTIQKFHGEADLVVCNSAIGAANAWTAVYIDTSVVAIIDSFILAVSQPLTFTNITRTRTQTCTNPGCLTDACFLGTNPVCAGSPVSFVNQSLLADTFLWKVNGTSVSTNTNLNYSFPGTGSYSVRLIASNLNGCADSMSQTVVVPASAQAISNSPVTTGDTISLSALTISGAAYSWTGPNGFVSSQQNPFIANSTALNSGTYYVTVTSGNCTTTDSVNVLVTTSLFISGSCLSPMIDSIRTVKMDLSGTTINSLTAAANGTYSFNNLFSGGNYTVTPSKNNDSLKTNGVSTLDVVLIMRHILNIDTLNTPYKILAADANNTGTVSTLDLIFIRKLILGADTTFPGNRLWSFIPSTTVFSDPLNPWNPSAPPASRNYPNLVTSQLNQDFIGVKLGDVNNSWNHNIAKTHFSGEIEMSMPEISAQPGDVISIPVSVAQFREIAGLQGTLQWNPALLEFLDVANAKLDCHFGKQKVQDGMLSLSWNENAGGLLSLGDESPAFILSFKVKGPLGSTTFIQFSDDITSSEAYSASLDLLEIKSRACTLKVEDGKGLNPNDPYFSVYPNPNNGTFTLVYSHAGMDDISVRIYNGLGQEIMNEKLAPSGGLVSRELDISSFGKGIYTLVAGKGERQMAWKIRVE